MTIYKTDNYKLREATVCPEWSGFGYAYVRLKDDTEFRGATLDEAMELWRQSDAKCPVCSVGTVG